MAKVLIPAVAGGTALVLVGAVAAATALQKNDIELTVDGATEAISVRERTVGEVLELQGIELGDHDVVLPAADTTVTDGLAISVSYGRPLDLTVDGQSRTVWTTARTVGEALQQLQLDESDAKLSATRSAGIAREGLDLTVTSAKDVTIVKAGKESEARLAGTVADLLADQGIAADDDDIVKPALETELADGMKVTYVKVETKTRTKDKVIKHKTERLKTKSLLKGKTKVDTKGKDGKAVETYTEVYRDGKLYSSKLTDTKVAKKPVTEVIKVGTKVVKPATSSSDSGSGSGSSKSSDSKSSGSSNLSPASGSSCKASYYWQGQMTATGERFNPNALTAAHKTMKFGTKLKVTNPRNGKTVIVRINDRGPYISGRCLDLSRAAMQAIGGTSAGVITVNYEVVS
ncbi:MAG: septal ring lytic transglycosylase RlpA family protein [Arachnia sp.]